MDKITSGIIDKLGIIGFFNVFLSGAVVLYGISPILKAYTPGIFYLQLGLERDLEKAIVVCLLCFLFGLALQSMQELLFKGIKSIVANKCLGSEDLDKEGNPVKKGVLVSKYRQEVVIKLAKKLFEEKGLEEFDPEDKAMCSYFVDYCEYSNSVKGFSSKSSSYNESASFYEQLAVAFYTLVVIGIITMIFSHTNVLLYCLGYLIMGGLFTRKAYQCRLNWARAVLSTYEAVYDHERHKKSSTLPL